jgi:hypothetical protein
VQTASKRKRVRSMKRGIEMRVWRDDKENLLENLLKNLLENLLEKVTK